MWVYAYSTEYFDPKFRDNFYIGIRYCMYVENNDKQKVSHEA